MKIVINKIPNSLNKYMGRKNEWEYRQEKAEWGQLIGWLVKIQPNRPKKPLKHATVTITYFFGSKRRHDPDNYCGKVILDGLTQNGIIADDSFNNIELVLKGSYDKDNPRTEIEII